MTEGPEPSPAEQTVFAAMADLLRLLDHDEQGRVLSALTAAHEENA